MCIRDRLEGWWGPGMGVWVIVPLYLLVLGDEQAQEAVRGVQVITIDGCKLACANACPPSFSSAMPWGLNCLLRR